MIIEDIITLNERSQCYNRGDNAIYVMGVDDYKLIPTNPKVYYKEVNDMDGVQSMMLPELLAGIISMDIFVINPLILEECLDGCPIDFDDLWVEVRMDYFNKFLEVKVCGARMGLFLPCDIVGMKASKIAKRVYKNCKKHLLPVSERTLKMIEDEVADCIHTCIDDRVDYNLIQWIERR